MSVVTTQTDNGATTIRIAARPEASGIRDLLLRAYAEYATTFPWPDAWEAYYANLADVAGRWGHSHVLVAERAGEIVGSVDYHAPGVAVYSHPETTDLIVPADRPNVELEPTWAAVRCLAVDPDHRGTGAARSLIDDLIRRSRLDGATLVFLHSVPNMASAIGLYENLGFVRMPGRDFRISGNDRTAVLAFRLSLA